MPHRPRPPAVTGTRSSTQTESVQRTRVSAKFTSRILFGWTGQKPKAGIHPEKFLSFTELEVWAVYFCCSHMLCMCSVMNLYTTQFCHQKQKMCDVCESFHQRFVVNILSFMMMSIWIRPSVVWYPLWEDCQRYRNKSKCQIFWAVYYSVSIYLQYNLTFLSSA